MRNRERYVGRREEGGLVVELRWKRHIFIFEGLSPEGPGDGTSGLSELSSRLPADTPQRTSLTNS
jgi:hypothetical protein